MKNFKYSIIIALTCYSFSNIASEQQSQPAHYMYRQATLEDVPAIVDLINEHAYQDRDKIVVVPEAFRTTYVQNAIQDERLFVACYNQKIVGYKKLFCINNTDECNDILSNELRCKGNKPVACGLLSQNDPNTQTVTTEEITQIIASPTTTFIYTGADFTHPAHRGQGINSNLTKYALDVITAMTLQHIQDTKSTHVIIGYGLTQDNAGIEKNVLDGRSQGILKQCIPFFQKLAESSHKKISSKLLLSRYAAFKPSFDPKSTELKPLSDEQSIPGYGCLIACLLEEKNNTETER